MPDQPSKWAPDWAAVDAVLDRALDLEGPERAAYLQSLEPGLRASVERALTGHGAGVIDALIQASLADVLGTGSHGAPESIGPWRLVRELGAGGMAQVFEARREEPDFEQRAALKILWPFRAGEEFHERFIQERRILAGISHPGIAGLLDGGMLPDRRPWFAMEYVEGKRIDDYCRDLPLAQRLQVFLQVCDAVEFAHGRLIVHRDIKPANILVDATGRVRLLDFGIAKILDAADDGAMTRTGGSLLTLQYASPEQVTNAPLSVATDVYQLGMLLYQLLAGQLPYDLRDRSLKQAIEVICSTQPPAPSQYRSEVAGDLDAIVLFALRKEPPQRYRSVSALSRDVRQYLEGRPVAAQPQSRWYVFNRFVRRNAPLVAATALVIVALTVATLVSVASARRASQEAERSAAALRVLTGVFEQADPFGHPGPDLTLGQALIEGYDHIAMQVDHDPVLAARVFNQLGLIFSTLGLHEQSERAYRHSLDAIPAARGTWPGERLTAISGIAGATNDQGRFLDTLAWIDGMSLEAPHNAEEARLHIALLVEQVEALQASDQQDAARDRLEDAQALSEQFGVNDAEVLFNLHNQLANAGRHAGDFDFAVQHSREAAAYAGEAGNPGAQATLLQNLGIYLARQGHLDDAEPYFLEAMAIIDAQAPGHPGRLEFAVNYAGWLYRVDRVESAVTLLRDTLAALDGTPDRHLWAYANRDLATYALATGDIEDSLRANREYLVAAPELYGPNTPPTVAADVVLARHLSLAGLHEAALDVMQRALATHPVIGNFSLAPYLAEMRLDAGEVALAMRDYAPGNEPDDPNATLLGLKFLCAAGDLEALAARVQNFDPDALADGSHLDRRLLAWRHLMVAALARRAGEDPTLELAAAYATLAETPRLGTLDQWRLLREIMPLYATADSPPPELTAAWDRVARQQVLARATLQHNYLPEDFPAYRDLNLSYVPRRPLPLACLR